MDERRGPERHITLFQAEVSERGGEGVSGNLADISVGGMMIRLMQPLEVGQHMRLRVELPAGGDPDGALGAGPVTVETRVAWCDEDLAPGAYVAGLQFTGATPEDGAVARELVRVMKGAR